MLSYLSLVRCRVEWLSVSVCNSLFGFQSEKMSEFMWFIQSVAQPSAPGSSPAHSGSWVRHISALESSRNSEAHQASTQGNEMLFGEPQNVPTFYCIFSCTLPCHPSRPVDRRWSWNEMYILQNLYCKGWIYRSSSYVTYLAKGIIHNIQKDKRQTYGDGTKDSKLPFTARYKK